MTKAPSPIATPEVEASRGERGFEGDSSSATSTTLDVMDAVTAIEAARIETFEELVFAGKPTNRQADASYRRQLIEEDAAQILRIIWKESSFVSDSDLANSGLIRRFPNGITQHGLAVALAESPKQLSALNSRVRNICIAAEHYGLIERKAITPTKISLTGTTHLDHLMKTLGKKYADVFREGRSRSTRRGIVTRRS